MGRLYSDEVQEELDESAKAHAASKEEEEVIDKWGHFKTYYLVPVIVGAFVLACLVWMASDAFFNRKNIVYSGALVGCSVAEEDEGRLTSDFLQTFDTVGKKDIVAVTSGAELQFSGEEEYQNQSTDAAMFTFLAAGEFNYLIIDETLWTKYFGMEAFYDLTDLAKQAGIDSSQLVRNDKGEAVGILVPKEVREKFKIASLSEKVCISFVPVKNSGEKDLKFLQYLFR